MQQFFVQSVLDSGLFFKKMQKSKFNNNCHFATPTFPSNEFKIKYNNFFFCDSIKTNLVCFPKNLIKKIKISSCTIEKSQITQKGKTFFKDIYFVVFFKKSHIFVFCYKD